MLLHQHIVSPTDGRYAQCRFHPWQPADLAPALRHSEVHVWRTALDVPASRAKWLQRTLAPSESARAERFRFEEGRHRYIVARGWLRAVLASYLGVEPNELRFGYGLCGKPRLAEYTGEAWLRFNLSHSEGYALCAVAQGREVGIDLERIRGDRGYEAMAKLVFSPREISNLEAIPVDKQAEAFHEVWTRKEAFIKATGLGLSLPLKRLDVSFTAGDPSIVLQQQDGSLWSVLALDSWPGYAAALAVEGWNVRVSGWEYPADE